MTPDEYAQRLGRLVGNLQSLELALRAFLQQLPSARSFGLPYGTDVYAFPVGSEIPENEFTSWDTLGQLLSRFNEEMRRQARPAIEHVGLVALRDALAHGRISAASDGGDLRLLKFSRPNSGRVRITFNQCMTLVWFESQLAMTYAALSVVRHCINP